MRRQTTAETQEFGRGLGAGCGVTWRPRELSKSVISRVIIRVTPFRVLITLLITHSLSPMGLQVRAGVYGCGLRAQDLC